MKITMIISLLLGSLAFSTAVTAEDKAQKLVEEENKHEIVQEKEKKEKKRRRKKVLMCNECGKPETECECEGHHH